MDRLDVQSHGSTSCATALFLLFAAGAQLYAMESTRVVEVIPRVSLRPVVNHAHHIAGMFSYRGVVVPVVDLCLLIHGQPCGGLLSSRIIMVSSLGEADTPPSTLGLLAEGVTDTLSLPPAAFQAGGLGNENRPYLAGLALDERGMVQLLDLERLLRELRLPGSLVLPAH